MNKSGPIIIIDDDVDDREFIREAFAQLNLQNEIVLLDGGAAALKYFRKITVQPFLIMSDLNMPGITGMELRDTVFQDDYLRKLCVPYIFFTTSVQEPDVVTAYGQSAQGFFVKPANIKDLSATISAIVKYWNHCSSPELHAQ